MRKQKVYCYNKKGNFVSEHKSVTDAANATDTNPPAIHRCLNIKNYTAGGFYWRTFKRKNIAVPPVVVFQYDQDGKLINEYENIDIAVEKTGIKRSYIGSSLNSKKPKKTSGFYFSHKKYTKLELPKKINKYKLVKNNVEKGFPTIESAADFLGVTKQAVQRALASEKQTKGYSVLKLNRSELKAEKEKEET